MSNIMPESPELNTSSSWLRRQPVIAFFVLTCAISWGSWLAAILLTPLTTPTLPSLLLTLTAFGPLIAAVIMVFVSEPWPERHSFWQRLSHLSPGDGRTWLVIVLAFPALHLASSLLDIASGGSWPLSGFISFVATQPWFLPLFALDMLISGPLSQEIGWRGFALDKLLKRMGPLAASLALGGLWAAWQLPLLFLDDQRLTLDQILVPAPWLLLLTGVLSSFIYTWLFLRTNHSTLGAMLLRLFQNLSWALLPLSTLGHFFLVLLLLPVVALIVWIWGSPSPAAPAPEDKSQ
jgi:uncharacterized protein